MSFNQVLSDVWNGKKELLAEETVGVVTDGVFVSAHHLSYVRRECAVLLWPRFQVFLSAAVDCQDD